MILDEIAAKTRDRIEEEKKIIPFCEMRAAAEKMNAETGFPFKKALRRDDIAFICEVKKASPSKGVISEDFPYLKTAMEYEDAGAAAISVLTEPYYFMGKNEYLKEISEAVSIPTLRKDFTVSSYMIYEAKVLGAAAVLLICAILDEKRLREYLEISHSLGLSSIVEVHDEHEVEAALGAGAGIIGVNNRNLKDFTVDVATSARLRKLIPDDVVFVAESGIKNHGDIETLRQNGTDAVLIGETLMRAPDKSEMLKLLKRGNP